MRFPFVSRSVALASRSVGVLASASFASALALGSGCSSTSSAASCASSGTVTVTVSNQDDVTSNFVCNATVTITATSGGTAVPLSPQGLDGSNANCVYVANVPAGTYVIAATAPGYMPGMETDAFTCVESSPMFMLGLIAIDNFDAGDDAGDDGSDDAADDGGATDGAHEATAG